MKKVLLVLLMIVIGIVGVTLFGTIIHLLCIIDWHSHGEWIYTIGLTFLIASLPAAPILAIVVIAKISETIYHPYE